VDNKWLRVSFISQGTLAAYFQAVQWIPLGKWNYQPGLEPLLTQALGGTLGVKDVLLVALFTFPFFVFWIAWRNGWTWIVWIGVIGYLSWLSMELNTWWIAYIFGASDAWMSVYQRVFSQSTNFLPSSGRHLPPDALHVVLHILLFTIVFSTIFGLLKRHSVERQIT